MKIGKVVKVAGKFAKPYRVKDGDGFRLKDIDPSDTGGLGREDKPRAKEALQTGVEALARLQDMLYAQDRWSLLLVFQAMDAAGKDGAIKHVMSGINPQGCQVSSFKAPSAEELDHDFLWRCNRNLPERGRIGIFNRSYYEEVLVVRVHPETGRECLYLGDHAEYVVGMPYAEGRALIEELNALAVHPDLTYEHRWRAHELIVWDNRCLLHRATPYDPATQRRVVRRCTVLGEAPTGKRAES